jgi:hypothetical protein
MEPAFERASFTTGMDMPRAVAVLSTIGSDPNAFHGHPRRTVPVSYRSIVDVGRGPRTAIQSELPLSRSKKATACSISRRTFAGRKRSGM